jgi:hypothetical protein
VEDPGVEIVKKSSCGVGNATMGEYCNEVAGVNGKVKWTGVQASNILDENWKQKKTPYKNNPDVSLVVIEMKKITKKGNEKTAVLGYAVNQRRQTLLLWNYLSHMVMIRKLGRTNFSIKGVKDDLQKRSRP